MNPQSSFRNRKSAANIIGERNTSTRLNRISVKILFSLAMLGYVAVHSVSAEAASKGFAGIKCGTDISKALLGRTMPNERVVVTEARHKDLDLKDLGASELASGNAIWWRICGTEYVLIEDSHSVVRDVLSFPQPPNGTLRFEGQCTVNGAEVSEEIVAVLEDQPGSNELAARSAWKIDEKKNRFVPMGAAGLRCPRPK